MKDQFKKYLFKALSGIQDITSQTKKQLIDLLDKWNTDQVFERYICSLSFSDVIDSLKRHIDPKATSS